MKTTKTLPHLIIIFCLTFFDCPMDLLAQEKGEWNLETTGDFTISNNIVLTKNITLTGNLTLEMPSDFTSDVLIQSPKNKNFGFVINKANYTLTIKGSSSGHYVIIDGGAGYANYISWQDGDPGNVTSKHLITITKGNVILDHVIVQNCKGNVNGPGIFFDGSDGNLNFTNGKIRGCHTTASNGGGGICFSGSSSSNVNVRLKNVEIYGCYASDNSGSTEGGAAIRTIGGSQAVVTLDNCKIYKNKSEYDGGAIYWNTQYNENANKLSKLTITGGTKIYENVATKVGGGMMVKGVVDIEEAEIHDNTALSGGGIACTPYAAMSWTDAGGYPPTLDLGKADDANKVVRVYNNKATGTSVGQGGGGIYYQIGDGPELQSSGVFRLHAYNVEVTGNTANYGSGIYFYDNTTKYSRDFILRDCILQGNYAENINVSPEYKSGGGLYLHNTKASPTLTVNLENNLISDNQSGNGGGAYLSTNCQLNLSGGIISGNVAQNGGGGIYKLGSLHVVGTPVVKGNTLRSSAGANNVHIPSEASEQYIIVDRPTALACGTTIGVTKTTSAEYIDDRYTKIAEYKESLTNDNVPLRGANMTKQYQKCEFIIPASQLAEIQNTTLTKMEFHVSNRASADWGHPNNNAPFWVFMKEVVNTTTDAYIGYESSGATLVYSGRMEESGGNEINDSKLVVPFNENNFYYHSGNLLVGIWKIYGTTNSTNVATNFIGIEVSGACIAGYNDNQNNVPATQQNFLPKITFTKEDNSTWVFPSNTEISNLSSRNHFFFDDTQECGVYTDYNSPYSNPNSRDVYFVKDVDDSWLRQATNAEATGATPDYTADATGHVAAIHTNTGLAYFASQVLSGMDYADKTVTLDNDIDLSGHRWEPIGFCATCGDEGEGTTTFAGTFDGQGHTIYNLSCDFDYKSIGLFGHVSGTVKNVIVSGTVDNDGAINVGGISGEVGDGGEMYNVISTVSPTTGTNRGGLVGNIATGGSLKNSYANTACANGLVGNNAGTVENCYTRGATNLYATNTGSVNYCYYGPTNTEDNDGTNGTFSAVVKPYTYALFDNQVTAETESNTYVPTGTNKSLEQTLNNWVGNSNTYAQWSRPTTATINGDYPVLKMPDCEAVAANSSTPDMLHYGEVNTLLTNYTDDSDAIYLYKSTANVASNSSSSAKFYIDEDAAITQEGTQEGTITASVGITLKNTQTSTDSWDWHMFSSALTAAPLGFNFASDPAGSNHQYGFGNEPYHYSQTGNGYFPMIGNSYYREWDFYTYFEPQYHWINFKRNGNDHWHEDCGHVQIDYVNDPNHIGLTDESEYTNVNETSLIPGKGYLLATKQETMLQCERTLNNADVSIKVTTKGSYRTGYNLIGNPYQSYYDFNVFASDNASVWGGETSKASYVLLSGDTYTNYAYNASSNDYMAPRWLHPHQGFMIIAQNSGSVTFYNSKRITEGQSEFRNEQPDYPLVNLIATDDEGRRDLTTVELGRPDKGGAPKIFDLHLGKGCIYTHYDDQDYAIAFTRPGLSEAGVWFEADEEATFTLTWHTQNGDFSYLHLIDNITGTDVDCLTATEYRFAAKPDDYKSRFKLVFGYTGIEEPEVHEPVGGPTSFAFFGAGGELVVNGVGTLQLIDMTGRVLASHELHSNQNTVAMPRGTAGVYVLRLSNRNGTKTQKIVVQ